MLSCHCAADCESGLPDFVHDEIVPQLLAVIVTVPPLEGIDDGDAETLHTDPLVEQLIVMLPAPSTMGALQLLAAVPFTVTVNPNEGVGAKANVDETATARTRVMDRYMCMAYLEKRRRMATMARCRNRAIVSKDS